jgi:UDP-N-acetylmuramoyl-tripeptide--D-alanyl-D-alanine ligase
MKAALSVLADSGRHAKKLALLADMKELGRLSDELHAQVGFEAAKQKIDRVVFVGSHGMDFKRGFEEGGGTAESLVLADGKDAAWEAVAKDVNNYNAILVKGSRAMKMEILADRILEEK